jgi:hypothetical protein
MLRVCLATSWDTHDIYVGLHANGSLLHWRKSKSSLSYLGSRLAPIYMVLARISASMGTAFVSSSALKMPDVGGIPGLSGVVGNRRLSSLSTAMATAAAASSMLLCSKSSTCRAVAFMVMTPAGPRILSFR